jgi:simple sugar transport system substrate-binding protein
MVSVGHFGAKVPAAVQNEVLARQSDLASGKLHPFYARQAVMDNEGHEVIAAGKTLSDEQILGMNWLAAGVQGKVK